MKSIFAIVAENYYKFSVYTQYKVIYGIKFGLTN